MVLVLLHYCSLPLCYVLCACCVFPAVVSSAVIGLCSHFLQTAALQNMVTALQSARSTDCSTGAWWAGLVINLQFWGLQLGRVMTITAAALYLDLGSLVCSCSAAADCQHGAEMENWRIQSTFLTPGLVPCVL